MPDAAHAPWQTAPVNSWALALAGASVLGWQLVSKRAERYDISAAMALLALGLVLANGPWAVASVSLGSETVRELAEVTLALVLFGDASGVKARALKRDPGLSLRLLGIGLPLTILLGIGVAVLVLPGTGIWVAAAIAAIVAPTDAALGAPILREERIPTRIRSALNVESGLNDGIATPFVNLFLAAAVAGELGHGEDVGQVLAHILVGALFGAVAGGLGGRIIRAAIDRDLMAVRARPLAVLALAGGTYAAAVTVNGNGFIAAFVAGLAFGVSTGDEVEASTTFTDEAAEGLTLVVWWIFGACIVVPAIRVVGWQDVLFAVLALTVVRMLPVVVAFIGARLDRPTTLLVGWFGPRGLASVVFMLLAVDELTGADAEHVLSAVTVTVLGSVLAHGVSASPLAARYGRVEARRGAA